MNSNVARVALGIAAVAVAVLLLIVVKDDGGGEVSTSTPATTTAMSDATASPPPTAGNGIPTIVVRGGKPVGGVKDLSFDAGDRVRFAVESDVADEIHVHGYDISKDVEAGGTVSFDFPASIEGVFEAELEERKQPIAELTVNP